MSYIKLSDGSSWPRPALEGDDNVSVEWKLRHAPDQVTREDMLVAASIISAYGYLTVDSTRNKRDLVCREIRAHLGEDE